MDEQFGDGAGTLRDLDALRRLEVDEATFRSETGTAFRNYAIANMLRGHGTILDDPESVVEDYTWQCSILVTTRDLALAARETFVATLGQIAAAEDPEDPGAHLATMTYQKDTLTNKAGDQLFNPATIAA